MTTERTRQQLRIGVQLFYLLGLLTMLFGSITGSPILLSVALFFWLMALLFYLMHSEMPNE
jgi:flagellar biosynthesis component FlhA